MTLRGVELRPYQREATDLIVGRGNALLALVMGAGKTVTSIAAMEELIENGAIEHGLVIVPASLKFQWQEEIQRFTGQRALVIDGTKAQRAKLYPYVSRFRYTIIGYQTACIHDWPIVRDLDFDFIVCDEATAFKSMTSKTSRRIKFLGKRAMVRLALTGQPIENRPEELYSIMEFVDPSVLGSFKVFDPTFIVRDDYGRMVRSRNLPRLNKLLNTVMYRKTRDDIKDQFPDVIPINLPFRLSAKEQDIYDKAAAYTLTKLEEAAGKFGSGFDLHAHYGAGDDSAANQMRGDIMSGIMLMRMASDDPNLIVDSAHKYKAGRGDGSKLAAEFLDAGHLEGIPEVSSKMEEFVEYLQAILDEDPKSKVVVFTTFKGFVSRVQKVTEKITQSVIYTGDMDARAKHAAKTQFKKDPNVRLFISSDAGGYGVDIPEANHLISLDLPWSTGAYEQRESRIIRISSEWEHVTITNILAMGSIDEWMWGKITSKKAISRAWLDGAYDKDGDFRPDLNTLTKFLTS